MKLYTHDEMLDRVVGKKGTPRRDTLENAVNAYLNPTPRVHTTSSISCALR